MSIAERVPCFRESIVGRLAQAIGAETTGALIGSRLVGVAITLLHDCPELLLGAAGLALMASRIADVTHPFFKAALLAASFAVPATPCLVGEIGGTIIGGYLGLRLLNPTLSFFGEERSSGYCISTLRFELVGLFFRTLSLSSSIHYLTTPLNMGLLATQIALQNIAYHSHRLLPILQDALQPSKREKWSVSLIAKGVFSRFVDTKIQAALDRLFDFNIPLLGTKMSSLVSTLGLKQSCHHFLTPEAWPSFLTRSFPVFIDSLPSRPGWAEASAAHREAFFEDFSDEERFFTDLESKLERPFWLSADRIDPTVEDITRSLGDWIQRFQEDLIGRSLVTEKQKKYLERILPLYVRGYIGFVLTAYQSTPYEANTLEDEERFFSLLSSLLSQGYIETKMAETVVGKVMRATVSVFYSLLRQVHQWIATGEQSSAISGRLVVNEGYVARD